MKNYKGAVIVTFILLIMILGGWVSNSNNASIEEGFMYDIYTGTIDNEVEPLPIADFPGALYRKVVSSLDDWLGIEAIITLPEFIGDQERVGKQSLGPADSGFTRFLDNPSIYLGGENDKGINDVGLTWSVGSLDSTSTVVDYSKSIAYRPFWRYTNEQGINTYANSNWKELEYYYYPGDKIKMSTYATGPNHMQLRIELLEETTIEKYANIRKNFKLEEDYSKVFLTPEFYQSGAGNSKMEYRRVVAIDQVGNEAKPTQATNAKSNNTIYHQVYLYREIDEEIYRVPFNDSRRSELSYPNKYNGLADFTNAIEVLYDGVNNKLGGEKVTINPSNNISSGEMRILLEELINEITEENLSEDDYTSGSWTELQSALKEARKVLEDPESTREEIAAALFALDAARKGLVEKEKEVEVEVDKTKLQGKVDSIKGKALISEDFTTDSWNSLALAMEIAQGVLEDSEATQDDVNAALESLEVAHEGLLEKDKEVAVDKTKLQSKVDSINGEALVSGDFTTDSWDSLKLAMEIAQGVLDNLEATQDDINAALVGLEMAHKGLVGKDVTKEVDKNKLQNMLESIKDESLKEEKYTSDSWKSLKSAIGQAEKVLGDIDATQTRIDEALLALEKAHEGLQVRTGGTDGDNVKVDKDGKKLPSTATSIFNYGLAGVISLLAGLGLYLGVRRKKLEQ